MTSPGGSHTRGCVCLYEQSTGDFGCDADRGGTDPGDSGWDPALLTAGAPGPKQQRSSTELASGRLAVMTITGMFSLDGL